MADFIADALSLSPNQAPEWLNDLRRKGWSAWAGSTMPTRKTEAWKYTPLKALEQDTYLAEPRAPAAGTLDTESLRRQLDIAGLGARMLVFVNGFYSDELSDAGAD